jgi:bacterioferritin
MVQRGTKCVLPENIEKNIGEAMLLMGDYAGKVSEVSAIMQYMYQHYTLSAIAPETADVLEDIAITEMGHNELLGKTIVKLGGDPIFGADYRYWNAGFVNYTRDLKKMLLIDIQDEENAIENYLKTIEALETQSIRNMISCIIEEEKSHIMVLKELLKKAD